jgi:N-acetylglutamate synthase-like GNAT family acetyltransferase
MEFHVREAAERDRAWMLEVVRGWGADFVISRGRKVFPADLPGFIAEDTGGKKIGLLTYEVVGDQCEVVTLDAFVQFSGIGTALLQECVDTARAAGCRRLWLITTNDNLNALRFYQRRDMTIAAIHINALEYSRKLKPSIPEVAPNGIPLRDEIEFEMTL